MENITPISVRFRKFPQITTIHSFLIAPRPVINPYYFYLCSKRSFHSLTFIFHYLFQLSLRAYTNRYFYISLYSLFYTISSRQNQYCFAESCRNGKYPTVDLLKMALFRFQTEKSFNSVLLYMQVTNAGK